VLDSYDVTILINALKKIAKSSCGWSGNPYNLKEDCSECVDMQEIAKDALKTMGIEI
jgi:hypothetical protein